MIRKLTYGVCMFFGWSILFVGVVSIVASNHLAAAHQTFASAEWWASTSALPIAALFFVAAGSISSSQDQGEKK